MTMTAIAAELGVNKSTVSRQANDWGIVGPDKKVDIEEYKRRRAGDLDPALQTRGPAAGGQLTLGAQPQDDSEFQRERTRKMAADAARAEMELQARRGELVPRTVVAGVIGPAARQLRERLQEMARDNVTDDAERVRLADLIDDIFEQFARETIDAGGTGSRSPVAAGNDGEGRAPESATAL
ncbi:hypothetical protein [Rhodovarius crocodyli]|nr:hypothetical protein [Rhodovarius crocodyli]